MNDISIEQVPTEITDDYDHDDSDLEYILENVLQDAVPDNCEEYKQLSELYNTILVKSCKCCSVSENCTANNCSHGGNYIMDSRAEELVLNQTKRSDVIYECHAMCSCDPIRCQNRLVQYGPRANLRIVVSERYQSKGVVSTVDIPCGGFICEYAGELLTHGEAHRRISDNERHSKMNYVLCLNEIAQDNTGGHTTIVDPSRRGNVGRYLNHSCEPNCEIFCVRVDCPVPKIGIFAQRYIRAGEELCFHYGGAATNTTENNRLRGNPCLCGSASCRKFMPNTEFLEIKI